MRNRLSKENSRFDLMGLIFKGVFSGILVLGLCFAFYAAAYASFSQGRMDWMALLFWSIFLFWQIFPLFVAGFSAIFVFPPLLRFPISLPAVYIPGFVVVFAGVSALSRSSCLVAMPPRAPLSPTRVCAALLR